MNGSWPATFNNPSVRPSSKQGLEGKSSRCDSFTCNCFTLISSVGVGAQVQGMILKRRKCWRSEQPQDPTRLTARAAWYSHLWQFSPTTPVSHLFVMFEQMRAQIRDVLLSPTHSCRGALVLQMASRIQSPLNVMKVCFPWQRAGERLYSKRALSTCTFPPTPRHILPARPRTHSMRQWSKQSSDCGDHGGGGRCLIKWYLQQLGWKNDIPSNSQGEKTTNTRSSTEFPDLQLPFMGVNF